MLVKTAFRCSELSISPHLGDVFCRQGIVFYERKFVPFLYRGNPHTPLSNPTWDGHLRYNDSFADPSDNLCGPVTGTKESYGRLDQINLSTADDGVFCAHRLSSFRGRKKKALVAFAFAHSYSKAVEESLGKLDSSCFLLTPEMGGYLAHIQTTEKAIFCLLSLDIGRYPINILKSTYGRKPCSFEIVIDKNYYTSVEGNLTKADHLLWWNKEMESKDRYLRRKALRKPKARISSFL